MLITGYILSGIAGLLAYKYGGFYGVIACVIGQIGMAMINN